MKSILLHLFTSAFILVGTPSFSQGMTPLNFDHGDPKGYGASLVGDEYASGSVAKIGTIETDLNADNYPEYIVRYENDENCDPGDPEVCLILIFTADQGNQSWKEVFGANLKQIGLGPIDPETGWATIFSIDDSEVFTMTPEGYYDVVVSEVMSEEMSQ